MPCTGLVRGVRRSAGDAGLDPLTGRRMDLSESTTDEAEAERILSRLRNQVAEQQAARTKATLGCAFDGWLEVHEVEDNMHEGYEAVVVSGFT
jgi:integrase